VVFLAVDLEDGAQLSPQEIGNVSPARGDERNVCSKPPSPAARSSAAASASGADRAP
jgi:hypothetical protein